MKALLTDDHLIMWFAVNVDMDHPKLRPIPLGINAFAQGVQLNDVLQEYQGKGFPPKHADKLLLLSFANFTNPLRSVAWAHFCGPEKSRWVSCVAKPEGWSYVWDNEMLDGFYRRFMAPHKFLLCPPGAGPDTHRVWEALYLRTVPIVNVQLTGMTEWALRYGLRSVAGSRGRPFTRPRACLGRTTQRHTGTRCPQPKG
jgi:hypothetical protein